MNRGASVEKRSPQGPRRNHLSMDYSQPINDFWTPSTVATENLIARWPIEVGKVPVQPGGADQHIGNFIVKYDRLGSCEQEAAIAAYVKRGTTAVASKVGNARGIAPSRLPFIEGGRRPLRPIIERRGAADRSPGR